MGMLSKSREEGEQDANPTQTPLTWRLCGPGGSTSGVSQAVSLWCPQESKTRRGHPS